jgi:hypothetical protein
VTDPHKHSNISDNRLPGGAYTDAPNWPGAAATFDRSRATVIPPDPNLNLVKLAILFLEKYDILEAEDRKTIGQAIRMLSNPLMIMNVNEASADPGKFERMLWTQEEKSKP